MDRKTDDNSSFLRFVLILQSIEGFWVPAYAGMTLLSLIVSFQPRRHSEGFSKEPVKSRSISSKIFRTEFAKQSISEAKKNNS